MNSLSIFHFDAIEVRAVTIDGNPWFVASDVCAALGHSNPSKAVSDHVDNDDKSNHSLGLPGKQPLVVYTRAQASMLRVPDVHTSKPNGLPPQALSWYLGACGGFSLEPTQ